MEARGRLHQDVHFNVDEILGRTLEQALLARGRESGGTLAVFLKPSGLEWHRYFLDAGVGFWEELSEADAFLDFRDEGVELVDCAKLWRLEDATIGLCRSTVTSAPTGPAALGEPGPEGLKPAAGDGSLRGDGSGYQRGGASLAEASAFAAQARGVKRLGCLWMSSSLERSTDTR